MTSIGVDLGQFVSDPYGTGIQRVLQQLARHWPADVGVTFVLPHADGTFSLLSQDRALGLLSLPFVCSSDDALRAALGADIDSLRNDRSVERVRLGALISLFDAWLLPEVSYRRDVLERLELFSTCMPIGMIGYDALPMTDPGNYRFVPGSGSDASEYFRVLSRADAVMCISEYARAVILDRLRRDRTLITNVVAPGGDHIDTQLEAGTSDDQPVRFLRLGTLEARKRPIEILEAFLKSVEAGARAELVFVGRPNASSAAINTRLLQAVSGGAPVTWISEATDEDVRELVHSSDVFLSVGVEGFGIPVLEAIRLNVPVLYAGVQPAAELMAGQGATALEGEAPTDLSQAFLRFADRDALKELRSGLDANAVPTWKAFAEGIAFTMARLT